MDVDSLELPVGAGPFFARETIAGCWDEARGLVEANHKETGFETAAKFNACREFYVDAERAGVARLFTMRVGGRLAGYQVFFVYPDPDHGFQVCASTRTAFIVSDARLGLAAAHFMSFAHAQLKGEGVKVIFRQVRVGGPDYSPILLRQGFVETERTFMMVVR